MAGSAAARAARLTRLEHRQQRADGLFLRLEMVPHDEVSQVGHAQRADVRVEHGREKVHVRWRVRKVGREDELHLEHAAVPERLRRTCKSPRAHDERRWHTTTAAPRAATGAVPGRLGHSSEVRRAAPRPDEALRLRGRSGRTTRAALGGTVKPAAGPKIVATHTHTFASSTPTLTPSGAS